MVQSAVDVRTFEPQHDANSDRALANAGAGAADRGSDSGPTAAAATAVPHGNIPRAA